MRLTLVLALVTAVGCDEGGTNNNMHDMSAVTHHDMALTNPPCDVAVQDCAGSGMKCVATVDNTGTFAGACVPDGTVAEGQPCTTPQSDTMFLDDCKKGLFCDVVNVLGNSPVCRTVCTDDSTCPTGQRCMDGSPAGIAGDFGWCVPSCTPFPNGGCPTGSDCGESFDDFGDNSDGTGNGFFVCKPSGSHGVYELCPNGDSDCGTGLWCGYITQDDADNQTNAVCIPNCDDSHDCADVPVDAGATALNCVSYDDGPNNAGFCSF